MALEALLWCPRPTATQPVLSPHSISAKTVPTVLDGEHGTSVHSMPALSTGSWCGTRGTCPPSNWCFLQVVPETCGTPDPALLGVIALHVSLGAGAL